MSTIAQTNDAVQVDGSCKFLQALFQPGDTILFRPIETWTENNQKKSRVDFKGVQYTLLGIRDQAGQWKPMPSQLVNAVKQHNFRSEQTKANIFFGVCPRYGSGGKYDLAWQIRTVRVLWSDVDNCTLKEAFERCKTGGLPEPSIVVNSGHGVHLYWKLAEPFLIDDAGDPSPVFTEFIDQGPGKKKKPKKFIKNSDGEKIYIDGKDKCNAPPLSPKAEHIQDILAGIAAKIGGDHTTDLGRILRVPDTLNRKDERNGKEPVPCRLIELHPVRLYGINDFRRYADKSPHHTKREKLAKIKLPTEKILSPGRRDKFHDLLASCDLAEQGSRSEVDFALCCWCVENGVAKEVVWREVCHIGKFQEKGESYFQLTWAKAKQQTREKIYQRVQQRVTKHGAEISGSNGKLDNKNPLEFPLTDSGNAERMAALFGDKFRYCPPWKKFLVWDGRRWNMDDMGTVEQMSKLTARSILEQAARINDKETREAYIKFACKSESAGNRAAMIKLVQSEKGIPVLPDMLDKNPWLFNCENGTIDLRTGQLLPHNKTDMITKLSPVVYDPDAIMPRTEKFLEEIYDGDNELIQFVQRFLGYSLTGDVSEQQFAMWHGRGANGKSTLLNAVFDVMGPDYSMKASPDMLLVKYGETHPTALTDLYGKRLVAAIETDDGRRLAEALIKELTGGDRIRARRMREDFWEFEPTHKILLACNHKPVVRGRDHGMWRRIKLVPFDVIFPPGQCDKNLPAKLKAERCGLLTWMVRGCLEWQRHGLGESKAVVVATSDYAAQEDTLGQFITTCCCQGDVTARAADLVDVYKTWSGDRRMTVRRMTKLLTEMGVERYTNNGVCYRGIGLLKAE